MLLDNMRDLVLMPVSLVAALIDLVLRGEREGARFYKVLRWGAHSEEVIDVYSAIEHHERGDFKINKAYTVDGVIARLEASWFAKSRRAARRAALRPRWIARSISFTPKGAAHGERPGIWWRGLQTSCARNSTMNKTEAQIA
jgi:hypothetical protein